MKSPTEVELQQLLHTAVDYDSAKRSSVRTAKPKLDQALAERIHRTETKVKALELQIKQMEYEEDQENRKAKAKQERAAKDRTKPDSVAESFQHRERYKSGLSNKQSGTKAQQIAEYKTLAIKAKGQLAVVKEKFAAL